MQTALACVAAPALPRIVVPEMHFHSIGVGGEIEEIFDFQCDEYSEKAWEIVPAYSAEQAVKQMTAKIRRWVAETKCEWSPESEWEIKSYDAVAESEVIDAAKDWNVSFDDAAGRLMGWRCESDSHCEACDRYGMDGRVPTCSECYRCKPCVDAGETYYVSRVDREVKGPCPHCHWA
jgi:hypothetical protein